MALTNTHKAQIRFYCGWSARFHQFDSRLEMAMSALETEAEHEAQITNAIDDDPPGLLALLADIDAKLTASHGRLKANKVGSIELNRAEIDQLRAEGRRHVMRLCSILGVERRNDAYGSGRGFFASADGPVGDNWVGK